MVRNEDIPNCLCQKRGDVGLPRLVVNDLPFVLAALDCLELSAAGSVSNSDEKRSHTMERYVCYDDLSDQHHGCVQNFRVASQLKLSLLVDVNNAHQHVFAGDSNLVEGGPAIVL